MRKALNNGEEYFYNNGIKSGMIQDVSPTGLKKEDMLIISNEELVERINSAKFESFIPDDEGFTEISPDGIKNELSKAISENPMKFLNGFSVFFNLKDYEYFSTIFMSIKNIIQENRIIIPQDIIINSILQFIQVIKEKPDLEKEDLSFTITTLGWLFEVFILSQTSSLESEIDNILKNSILELIKLVKEKNIENNSMFSFVINDPKCLMFSSLIWYLYYHNMNNKIFPERDIEIKNFLINELKNINSLSIFLVFGHEFKRLWIIDKNWIQSNESIIFPEDDSKWFNIISHILLFSIPNHFDLSIFLIEQFKRASKLFIDSESVDKRIIERYLYCILVPFLVYSKETWSEPYSELVFSFIAKASMNQLSWLTTNLNIYTNANTERIELLWDKVLERLEKEKDSIIIRYIKQNLIHLVKMIELTKENSIRINKTLSEFPDNDIDIFSEILLEKFNSKTAGAIGEIFLHYVNAGNYSFYPEEKVKSLIGKLFQDENSKGAAFQICNRYFEKGIYSISDISKEYP